MSNILGTNISAPVVPFSTSDLFPSHFAKYGNGGLRTVLDLTERDNIKELRRENLMLVAVEYDSTSGTSGTYSPVIYQLVLNNPRNPLSDDDLTNNDNWVPLSFGGDNWSFPVPTSSFFPGNAGDRSYDDDFVYICIENNLWKRISMDFFVFNTSSTSGASQLDIELGQVPVFDGNDSFNYELVVKNVSSGTNGILVTFTDNSTSFINIETGDGWTFPPPLSSSSPGEKGERSFDEKYLYIAVDDNLWKRINLDFFVFNPSSTSGSTSGTIFTEGEVPIFQNGIWETGIVVKNVNSTAGGYNLIYTDNTKKFISKDSYPFENQNSTAGNTIIWDFESTENFEITLEGDSTLSLTNIKNGDSGILIVNQDSTGGWSLTLPSGSIVENGGGGVVNLTSSANAIDKLEFFYNGTNIFWDINLNYT